MKHGMKRAALMAALTGALAPLAWAQQVPQGGAPLVTGPAGQVTSAEVVMMVRSSVPAQARDGLWRSEKAVDQFASSLYGQRVLAQEAVKEGLDKTPEGAIYLKLMREKALTELLMQQRVEAASPDEKTQEAFARAEYKAKPEQFKQPERVRARHILLAVAKDGSDDAAMKAKADELVAQLRKGADFDQLARENSADKSNAERGGDLGFFSRGRMVKPFEDAAFGLKKPGDISAPVKTQFGYHIIRLEERQAAGQLPYEEVKAQLRERLQMQMDMQERRKVWDKARASGKVNEDAVKALAKSQSKS